MGVGVCLNVGFRTFKHKFVLGTLVENLHKSLLVKSECCEATDAFKNVSLYVPIEDPHFFEVHVIIKPVLI